MRSSLLHRVTRATTALACATLAAFAVTVYATSPEPLQREIHPTAAAPEIGLAAGGDLVDTTLSDAHLDTWFQHAAALGVRRLRIPIFWAQVEPTKGNYTWGPVDRILQRAQARGMTATVAVVTTPAWARAYWTPVYTPPLRPTDFAAFAAQVATRYALTATAMEVWNEPNGKVFWESGVNPAAYTTLLKAAYPAIKAANSAITVIAGVQGAAIDSWATMNPVTFINRMYDNGAQGNFDALSYHPYQFGTKFSAGGTLAKSPLRQLASIRQKMIAKGDTAKQIWFTEYGLPTSAVSQPQQAAYLQDFLASFTELPWAGPAYIYTLRDTGKSTTEQTFGIMTPTWEPKPAYTAVQTQIAAGNPKPAEWAQFGYSALAGSVGEALTPVYPFVGSFAQEYTLGALFKTAAGALVSTPKPAADKVIAANALPTTPFADGKQTLSTNATVFYSATTGAWLVGSGVMSAWTSALGLATSGEVGGFFGTKVTFERGYITWSWSGAKATITG